MTPLSYVAPLPSFLGKEGCIYLVCVWFFSGFPFKQNTYMFHKLLYYHPENCVGILYHTLMLSYPDPRPSLHGVKKGAQIRRVRFLQFTIYKK